MLAGILGIVTYVTDRLDRRVAKTLIERATELEAVPEGPKLPTFIVAQMRDEIAGRSGRRYGPGLRHTNVMHLEPRYPARLWPWEFVLAGVIAVVSLIGRLL